MARKWIFLVAAALAVAGCTRNRTIDATGGAPREVGAYPGLIAVSKPYVPDVPVPLDFKIVEKQSIDFGAGSARYVRHVYRGKADKWDVKTFYEKQMPINRWSLVTYMTEDGEVSLEYEKSNERCRVIVTDGSWFYPVRVIVRLWTSGPVVPKKPKPSR